MTAIARVTSLSVIAPTPLCSTRTWTSSVFILVRTGDDRLQRAVHVRFHHDGQLADILLGHLAEHILDRARRRHDAGGMLLALAIFGDFPAHAFPLSTTTRRSPASGTPSRPRISDRGRRTRRLDRVAPIVDQRTRPAPETTADDDLADIERALLDQGWSRPRPRPLSSLASMTAPWALLRSGLAPSSSSSACSSRPSINLSRPVFSMRADLDREHVAAIFLEHDLLGKQLLLDLVGIGFGAVDLVDRHHDRHALPPWRGRWLPWSAA